MMEVALRKSDRQREWLASLDKCINQDTTQYREELNSNPKAEYEARIVHFPILWRKYHNRLVNGALGTRGGFWVAMMREATEGRLSGKKRSRYARDTTASGWDSEYIDKHRKIWNEDVLEDASSGGDYLGGQEHWEQFDVL